MTNKIKLMVSKDDPEVAYLYLPDHPGKGKNANIVNQIRLYDLIENFKGPDIYIDINEKGQAVGIEIQG